MIISGIVISFKGEEGQDMKRSRAEVLCCSIKQITNILQQVCLKEHKNNPALKHPGSYLVGTKINR